jgi:hypothetical protein
MKIGELHQYNHDLTTIFFQNVVNGLKNIFLEDEIVHIESYDTLVDSNIEALFIINDHHNSNIYTEQRFINFLNEKNIRVIIFNYEKIFNSYFPWNVNIQAQVDSIKNKHQFVSDVYDLEKLNQKIPCKQFLSKSINLNVTPIPWEQKLDRILFLGCIYGEQYQSRLNKINTLARNTSLQLPVDIVITNNKLTYQEFIEKLNNYKYVVNLFGTGTFVNIRHYEAARMGCVVLQEVTKELLVYYPELSKTCIPFFHVDEIPELLNSEFKSQKEFFLEDYYNLINLKSFI